MPRRIRLSRARGWRLPAGAVNVARPGRWGNPFRVGVHGTAKQCVESFVRMLGGYLELGTDNLVDQLTYLRYTKEDVRSGHCDLTRFITDLRALRGKDLACWCRPGAPCHGDVLLKLANRAKAPEPKTLEGFYA